MACSRHGLFPGQVDLGYRFIQLMEALGLAWDVQTPETLPARDNLHFLVEAPATRRPVTPAWRSLPSR